MIVLGIESTCDETAASIVKDGKEILSQVISSQVDLHNLYGGVVPELACRRHMEVILPVIEQALTEANKTLEEIDLFAVAHGPGLVGPLYVGLQTAKALAFALNKPLIGVNHIEAHLYAAYMSTTQETQFPALGLVISGGHTSLIKIHEFGKYELLGQTLDDAIGEAFDKVAKLLGYPYPGGPIVEKLAKTGNPNRFSLKAGRSKTNPLHFSFSGLKTAVLYAHKEKKETDPTFDADLCASFQKAALMDLVNKTVLAAEKTGCHHLFLGGGVTNNQELRRLFSLHASKVITHFPSSTLSLDNASMIAGLGWHQYRRNGPSDLATLEVQTRIPF